MCIEVTIANEDPLGIAHLTFGAGEVSEIRIVCFTFGNRHGQFAGRRDVSEEHVHQGMTRFLTREPCLQDTRSLWQPLIHQDRRSSADDDNGVRIGSDRLSDEIHLIAGQKQTFPILTLGFFPF